LVLLFFAVLFHEMNRGMLGAEHADDSEDGKPEGNLDRAIALELMERFRSPRIGQKTEQAVASTRTG